MNVHFGIKAYQFPTVNSSSDSNIIGRLLVGRTGGLETPAISNQHQVSVGRDGDRWVVQFKEDEGDNFLPTAEALAQSTKVKITSTAGGEKVFRA